MLYSEAHMEEILKLLENDARLKPEQIVTMTGKSVAEVKNIIKAAEKDCTILKYKAVINWSKTGEEEVLALIEVKIQPQRETGFDAVAERIYKFPEVKTAYLLSGTYDLALLVTGKTMQEVASFVSKKLAPIESVQSTVTHFLLKRYKDDGIIYEEKEGPQRQTVTL